MCKVPLQYIENIKPLNRTFLEYLAHIRRGPVQRLILWSYSNPIVLTFRDSLVVHQCTTERTTAYLPVKNSHEVILGWG